MSEDDRGDAREAASNIVMMVVGAYGIAFAGGKLGLLPPALAQYGLPVRGAVLASAGLIIVTLFSVVVGFVVAQYLKWRYSHLGAFREVRADD